MWELGNNSVIIVTIWYAALFCLLEIIVFGMDELFVKDGRPIPGIVLRKESFTNLSRFAIL